jgi:hypothetical protein
MHRRRLSRLVTFSLAACVPVLGLAMAYGPVAGASTTAAPASQHARALAVARTAIRHLEIGQHSTDHRVSAHTAKLTAGGTQVESGNWSGYADLNTSGNTYATVTGKWTEPSVTCSGTTTELAAFWVGIDGYSSDSVEQDGTLAECYDGSLYSFSWWEMYPTNDIQVVGESVAAGDVISASVVRSGTSYALKVTDSTHTANSFSTTQTCSDCANSSAEWIAEAPSGSSGVYPLPDFHTWTETSSTVKSGSVTGVISTFPWAEITMVDGSGNVEAQPSALNSSGNGFTVTWKRSS